MHWEILTTEEDVASLKPEWDALQQRIGHSLFTGHGWLASWWRFIGAPGGYKLYVIAGRREGKLAALATFSIRKRSFVRLLEWAGSAVADYSDVLLENPDDAKALFEFARRYLPFDLAQLKEVHEEAACLPALAGFAKPARQSEARCLKFNAGTFDDWMAAQPYAVRKHYRARLKQAEAIGPLRYEVLTQGPVPEEALALLVSQKATLLKAQGRKGVFDAPGAFDFFRAIAESEGKNGTLHFSTLSCGSAAIATHLGFVFQGRFLSYMPSYDPAMSQLSPGRLMMFRCIAYAMENGCTEFDYMRGEDQYKGRFSNHARMLKDFTFARTLLGKIAAIFHARRAKARATSSPALGSASRDA